MKRSWLPLTALRAFEAAGRRGSFKAAAGELAVSEAAVSRQIRDLERFLGVALFERQHRRVRLTAPGERILGQVTASFNAISAVLSEFRVQSSPREVQVSVEPTFATLFLIPRLAEFAEAHPEIDLKIESSSVLVDFEGSGPVLAIRHGVADTTWPRSEARHLMDNAVTPMLAPHLAPDFSQVRLLRDENDLGWMRWLEAAGVEETPHWGPVFSDAAIAIQSAELGQGAALGNRALAAGLLERKALMAPFDLEVGSGAYWLVARDFGKLTPSETVFCDWLVAELRAAFARTAALPKKA
jgi:LysR family transcriptional regulator, glycine cleavage system transcriptional activator